MTQWNSSLAGVVNAIGDQDFYPALTSALRQLADFDHAIIHAYRGKQPPVAVFNDLPDDKQDLFINRYRKESWLLDPFFQATFRDTKPGLYRLQSLATEPPCQREYIASYYAKAELAEQIGYLINLPNQVTVLLSLLRKDHQSAFDAREFRELEAVAPLATALVQQQLASLHPHFSAARESVERSAIRHTVNTEFQTFGDNVLSDREREIVAYVLKGKSSASIGTLLDITVRTVQNHRKNIYTKLGISSQGELFSRFISGLCR